MKIHEYQAKNLLKQYVIPVQEGSVVEIPASAVHVAEEIGKPVVVKAQIHAGGRGKGGGIKFADTPEEAMDKVKEIIGMNLVTHQTGPAGKLVRKVLIAESLDIDKELYMGMVVDRENNCITAIASEEGGVEIETIAGESPEKILKVAIDPRVGIQPFQARKIAFGLNLPETLIRVGTDCIINLYRFFTEKDVTLAEINPWVITKDGRLLAADAKINFDDNALAKHPDIEALRDFQEEEPAEVEASKHRLSYIKLDGHVGCMVNGAGLAMATMDIIKLHGALPANFLDVGGAASSERVERAFRILLSDKNVKAVLINIFGGIVRCDRVAKGVIEAAKRLDIQVPIVIRLAGTNYKLAGDLLNQSELKFTVASDLKDAAQKVVAVIK